MQIEQRDQLGPLLPAMSVPNYRLPTPNMAAVFALSDGQFDISYLDVRVTEAGIQFVFSWIKDDVFGQVTAASSQTDWHDLPLREQAEDARISVRLRRLSDIDRVDVDEPRVWNDGWNSGALTVDAPLKVRFRDGDYVTLGDHDPRNSDVRERRDAFTAAVLRAFRDRRP